MLAVCPITSFPALRNGGAKGGVPLPVSIIFIIAVMPLPRRSKPSSPAPARLGTRGDGARAVEGLQQGGAEREPPHMIDNGVRAIQQPARGKQTRTGAELEAAGLREFGRQYRAPADHQIVERGHLR